ncbi:MAG: hypothetical protein V4484_07765 [Pseudomonadota bacterium]
MRFFNIALVALLCAVLGPASASQKHEILAKAVGDYKLTTISGSGGANGMWETWKQNGKWGASASGMTGDMRTGTDIALDRNDMRLLDSLTIRVDPGLGVRFLAGARTLLAIPYRDDGMHIEVNQVETRDVYQLNQLTPDTTVLDDHLYLLARDGVDYSPTIHGNFVAAAGNLVIVSYLPQQHTFELTFYPDDCCGASTYTFARRPTR